MPSDVSMESESAALADRDAGSWRPGYCLPAEYYTSDDLYRNDIRVLSRRWLMVDHVNRIPNPGDYFLFELGDDSVIVVRTRNGEVRAHHNVCRHRGSRICLESDGNARYLVCPYHAWSYDLEGKLRKAQPMGEDFDPAQHGLHPCHVRIFEGLIFLNLSLGEAPDFETFIQRGRPFLSDYGIADLKVAARRNYPTMANWKLVSENFSECSHCRCSHGLFTQVFNIDAIDKWIGYDSNFSSTQVNWEQKQREAGRHVGVIADGPESDSLQVYVRQEIGYGHKTGTADGEPVAPLIGNLKEYDNGWTNVGFEPMSVVVAFSDYVVLNRYTPRSADLTDFEVTWLVHKEAKEGKDYDLGRLLELFDVTVTEDKKIVEDQQRGVHSSAYRPGPFGANEGRPSDICTWYMSHFNNSGQDLQ